jgi:hypothetical protein
MSWHLIWPSFVFFLLNRFDNFRELNVVRSLLDTMLCVFHDKMRDKSVDAHVLDARLSVVKNV